MIIFSNKRESYNIYQQNTYTLTTKRTSGNIQQVIMRCQTQKGFSAAKKRNRKRAAKGITKLGRGNGVYKMKSQEM